MNHIGSKYQVILRDILNDLETGVLHSGDMLPTEQEYINHYGVSRTTVQRAMNILVERNIVYRVAGKGTFVSEDKEASPVCLQPDGSPVLFALLLPYNSRTTKEFTIGVQTYLESKGCQILVKFTDNRYESELKAILASIKAGVAGILLYPSTSNWGKYYKNFHFNSIPIVTIDKKIDSCLYSSVTSDNYMGGYLAAQYLIEKGHRDIVVFSDSFLLGKTLLDRYRGFVNCLQDYNISLKKGDVYFVNKGNEFSDELISWYFKERLHSLPTACFCLNDIIASAVYQTARELNIKIPSQLSVIGYDDLEVAQMISPTLTTVRQPYTQIGNEAARLIFRAYARGECMRTHLELPVEVIERASVCDIRAKV